MLVLAVDRLDYETLHLLWLKNLDKMAKAAGESSLQIQTLCHLFSLFMVQSESKSLLPASGAIYSRENSMKRLEKSREVKFAGEDGPEKQ